MTLAAAPACVHFDNLEEPIELATHAGDWRDQVIYQILVDRFADADYGNNYGYAPDHMARYHGGDWAGIEQNLDYLQELGVTALWISPVIKNVDTDAGVDGYHGYWAQDLTRPNPHFGDVSKLRELVAAAHDHGMLVIIDIVTNHMGQAFYYDINLNGQPDIQIQESGQEGKKDVVHITEYDPDFDARGIQAFTSLGEAGPAPIIFQFDPATNHIPPLPLLFQDPAVYNRKGRTYDFSVEDQLLHGDFNALNVIVTPAGPRLIDFDDCGYGPVAFDVANALYMVLFDASVGDRPKLYATFRPGFLAGYRQAAGRPLDDGEVDGFIDARVAALGRWLDDLPNAPIGIRTSSPEWLQTLRAFVAGYRSGHW